MHMRRLKPEPCGGVCTIVSVHFWGELDVLHCVEQVAMSMEREGVKMDEGTATLLAALEVHTCL